MRRLFLTITSVLILAVTVFAQDKTDNGNTLQAFSPTPETNEEKIRSVKAAVEDGINLLENNKTSVFVARFLHPEEETQIMENYNGSIAELVRNMQGDKGERLLNVLKDIRSVTPVFEEDRANFGIDSAKWGRDTISFERLNGRWYLLN